MLFNRTDALKVAKKTKVGGVAHVGEYCIVKYGRENYHTYKASYLFSTEGYVVGGTLEYNLGRVFALEGAEMLRVIVDNN